MRSTDYISKGTAVARLYKARESLLMDKDCRKGLCFYLREVRVKVIDLIINKVMKYGEG